MRHRRFRICRSGRGPARSRSTSCGVCRLARSPKAHRCMARDKTPAARSPGSWETSLSSDAALTETRSPELEIRIEQMTSLRIVPSRSKLIVEQILSEKPVFHFSGSLLSGAAFHLRHCGAHDAD